MKRICHYTAVLFAVSFLFIGCDKQNGKDASDDGGNTGVVVEPEVFDVSYTESFDDFCNPERGFYKYTSVEFKNDRLPSPLSVSSLAVHRKTNKTLIFQYNYITDFIDKDISAEALDIMRKNMQALREAGMKVVLRFAYKDGYDESDLPWDATVEQTLRHVEQLKPIFQEYGDVIYVLQAGFVGSWGEWYYTSYFNFEPKTVEEYAPRAQLLKALLDAMPKDRQVAVRYPKAKLMCMDMDITDSLTAETAFSESDLSRIAGHNDCFVSSGNDVGTYTSKTDRELWRTETQYTSMGGETCKAMPAYCACTPTFKALEDYHWSYLNSDYNVLTHNVWKEEGCFDEISRRLGYRLVLEGANYGEFVPGEELEIDIKLKNVGFASVINPRDLEFIIVNKADASEKYVIKTDIDPRRWGAGKSHRIKENILVPASIKSGAEYNLCLNLPDPEQTLHDNPLFSIRLANEGVWEEETGYNVLKSFVAE